MTKTKNLMSVGRRRLFQHYWYLFPCHINLSSIWWARRNENRWVQITPKNGFETDKVKNGVGSYDIFPRSSRLRKRTARKTSNAFPSILVPSVSWVQSEQEDGSKKGQLRVQSVLHFTHLYFLAFRWLNLVRSPQKDVPTKDQQYIWLHLSTWRFVSSIWKDNPTKGQVLHLTQL